jgi:beta-phosphoglucomutase-like phosphatase (HAD superfamily)
MKLPCSAIVLDMNGVILQSNHIKHAAMLELFTQWPQYVELIDRYNRGSGGISRRAKFRHIWESILRLRYDGTVETALSERYEEALAHSLPEAPIVEGIDRLFADANVPIYVCSAAPEKEVRRELEYRHFLAQVAATYGDTTRKSDALRQVIVESRAKPHEVVFFGDSSADRAAAMEVGVRFIAVTREKNEFAAIECPKIVDFRDWNALVTAALQA